MLLLELLNFPKKAFEFGIHELSNLSFLSSNFPGTIACYSFPVASTTIVFVSSTSVTVALNSPSRHIEVLARCKVTGLIINRNVIN